MANMRLPDESCLRKVRVADKRPDSTMSWQMYGSVLTMPNWMASCRAEDSRLNPINETKARDRA